MQIAIARSSSRRRPAAGPAAAFALGAGLALGASPASGGATFHLVYTFDGSLGAHPAGELALARNNVLYGTLAAGGAGGNGAVFKLHKGVVTVVHAFQGGADGGNPNSGVTVAKDGTVYGTANTGGAAGWGTLFRVAIDGTYSVVYSFPGGHGGGNPRAPLFEASDGNFYGTTFGEGDHGFGVAYGMTPAGAVTVLHQFDPASGDGSQPSEGFTQAKDGLLYGTTEHGGSGGGIYTGEGTVIRMDYTGNVTVLRSFYGSNGFGSDVDSGLVLAPDRKTMYGSTNTGGFHGENWGTVFQVRTSGKVSQVAKLSIDEGGFYPTGHLAVGADGNIYSLGGNSVFMVTPDGGVSRVHKFNGTDGRVSYTIDRTGLAGTKDGDTIWGMTNDGGAQNAGTIFSVTVTP